MSSPTIEAGSTPPVHGSVALVADGQARTQIAGCLEKDGVKFDAFRDAVSLVAHSHLDPPVIAVWVESPDDGIVAHLEPLTERFADSPIVLICPTIERWGVRAALTSGAAGVVLSDDLDIALDPCLRAVRAGQTCVPQRYSRQIEPPALSSREKQILGLVVMGYSNGQIAEQLFLAESTVKSHLSSSFGKLGVRSRNDAVNLIIDPGRGLGVGILALGGEPVESA